ncbi:MAG: S8 family serine peptidase, partial [Bacteroidia bacterium]|nr:S8 family serine peptidase [Bacteroidia bacterium]
MRIFLMVLLGLLITGLPIAGQNIYTDRLDGQIYLKVSSDYKVSGGYTDSGELAPESIAFLQKFIDAYQITKMYRSFWFADDAGLRRTFRIHFKSAAAIDRLIHELMRLPGVEYAEYVPLLKKDHTPNDMGSNSANNGTWHLHKINAQQAWDISKGSTAIKVAVVDDAVQVNHPDLAANMLPGRDVALGTNNPNPPNTQFSHGTHVAGIVAAATNNGIGVASIGYSIKVIPVKATDEVVFITHGYEGITWAANNGARVINMSWGGSYGGQTGMNVINNAYGKGITLVAGAGNDDVQTAFYPAAFTNCIAVASTSSDDAKSVFSNYGVWVDISAPGSLIRSTVPNSTYAVYSGTSMASPLVAGLCGLVLSINPSYTPAQVRNCITSSADNINNVNSDYIGRLGAGRINAYKAALCAQSSVIQYDASALEIIQPRASLCVNGFTPSFILRNNGSSPLTKVDISWNVDNGASSNFQWTGSLAPQNQTTVTLPAISNLSAGNHTFSVSTGNIVNGNQNDQNTNNNNQLVNFVVLPEFGRALPFIETFESNSFATNGWEIENPDNEITWELFNTAGTTPGNKSARLPFWSYSDLDERDALCSPPLNLTGYSSVSLRFEHAYRRFDQYSSDSLIVGVSTDCGQTWQRILARGEGGNGTFATAAVSTSDFVPATADDWCISGNVGSPCYTVSLNSFIGKPNVRIRFETFNNFQNNLYIDNINVSGVLNAQPPVANFSALPGTSVCAGSTVTFTNLSTNQPNSFQWSFPGGTPSSSTEQNPSVTYTVPGNYQVSLTVSNSSGNNTKTLTNYITVNALPQVQAQAIPATICQGEVVRLTASGASVYTWKHRLEVFNGQVVTITPDSSKDYELTASNALGCQVKKNIQVIVNPKPLPPTLVQGNDTAFVVYSPSPVAGHYAYSVATAGAGWGVQPFAGIHVKGRLVLAHADGTGDSLACSTLANATELAGNIAVVYRGDCEFGIKAANAQQAGAIACIIVNNDETLVSMAGGVSGANVEIPVIMLKASAGLLLHQAIREGAVIAGMGQFRGGQEPICPEQELLFALNEGYFSYHWSDDGSSAVDTSTQPGWLSYTVRNNKGCAYSDSILIESATAIGAGNILGPSQVLLDLQKQYSLMPLDSVQYQWTVSGGTLLSGQGTNAISVLWNVLGEGFVEVKISNNKGCIETRTRAVFVDFGAAISGLSNTLVRLYPNPAEEYIVFDRGNIHQQLNYLIVDALGRQVLEGVYTTPVRIDIHAFSPGVYFIQMEDITVRF